jgi:VWFA-related protein
MVLIARYGPSEGPSFPRKRESTRRAVRNVPPEDWVPTFAGTIGAAPRSASVLIALSLMVVTGFLPFPGRNLLLAAAQQASPSQGQAPILRTRHNEVLVRVAVRDTQGKPVGGLKQEDFRLFDNGKPQAITHFEVESPAAPGPPSATPERSHGEPGKETTPRAEEAPRRYVLLVFDNVHATFEGLVRAREAGEKFLSATMSPSDRIAIATASGDSSLEFTDDRKKLEEALRGLKQNFHGGNPLNDCPRLSDYVVDRLVNSLDPEALPFAMAQAAGQHCAFANQEQAEAFSRAAEGVYRAASLDSLNVLERMTRRLGSAPGERNLILVSPGFVAFQPTDALDRIIERALRAGVVISALDPEGLINPSPIADASQQMPVQPPQPRRGGTARISNFPALIELMATDTQLADWDVLAELAESTGGRFFHNNNDIASGFRELAGPPEVSYVLAFSPQNLKSDGKFHRLKVELANGKGLTLTARRGYFAPAKTLDASAQAGREIQEAVLSLDEVRELPVEISTQFYQLDARTASLAVIVHLDAKTLAFHKEGDRNADDLTFVTAVFDRDGKYVDGHRKRMQLRLNDRGLATALKEGIGIRDDFQLVPGSYRVREVVRDSEGGALSALNTSVDISF